MVVIVIFLSAICLPYHCARFLNDSLSVNDSVISNSDDIKNESRVLLSKLDNITTGEDIESLLTNKIFNDSMTPIKPNDVPSNVGITTGEKSENLHNITTGEDIESLLTNKNFNDSMTPIKPNDVPSNVGITTGEESENLHSRESVNNSTTTSKPKRLGNAIPDDPNNFNKITTERDSEKLRSQESTYNSMTTIKPKLGGLFVHNIIPKKLIERNTEENVHFASDQPLRKYDNKTKSNKQASPTKAPLCPLGKHGRSPDCQPCHCRDGALCDRATGACRLGCSQGWSGAACNHSECTNGTFSPPECIRLCHCKDMESCNPHYGTCNENGCQEGFTGPACQDTTLKCKMDNPRCRTKEFKRCYCNDPLCKLPKGECNSECPKGYKGPSCNQQVCPRNRFGPPECKGKCHCRNNRFCDQTDGTCETGCAELWSGRDCSQRACPRQRWGYPACKHLCFCAGVAEGVPGDLNTPPVPPCDDRGRCPKGCRKGWKGPSCSEKTCPAGRWGPKCDRRCHCAKNNTCNPTSGRCELGGCDKDYGGFNCTLNLGKLVSKRKGGGGQATEEEEAAISTTSVVLSSVVGGGVLSVVATYMVVTHREHVKQKRRLVKSESDTEHGQLDAKQGMMDLHQPRRSGHDTDSDAEAEASL